MPTQLMRFPTAVARDPAIEAWMRAHPTELGAIAERWFEAMRGCGGDVRELLHDGAPTACVGDAAFAYVDAFRAHANVGFFRGAEIDDPRKLLEGRGRYMRHVKLGPRRDVDDKALHELIRAAYADMKRRVAAEAAAERRAPAARQPPPSRASSRASSVIETNTMAPRADERHPRAKAKTTTKKGTAAGRATAKTKPARTADSGASTAPSKRTSAARSDASRLIDQRIADLDDWRGATLARVRALVRKADPDVVEEWKWRGVPVWSHDGILCTGETYKSVVKMTFAKGASLDDPAGLFNSSLEGSTRRAIDVREGETIDEKALQELIRAAVVLNTSRTRR